MTRKYFGTDGVRGKVGREPITPDFVMHLGYAAGKVLAGIRRKGQERPAVLIGKDTRVSGYMLESALEAGLSAAGVDVLLVGPMPTPAVSYLTRALRLSAGIVISASHNPYDDNGIKFFSGDGAKLPDVTETAIERELARPLNCMVSSRLGKARRIDDAAGRYIEFCKTTFPGTLHLRARRGLSHRAARIPRARGGRRDRGRRSRRLQHQRSRRRHVAPGAADGGEAAQGRSGRRARRRR